MLVENRTNGNTRRKVLVTVSFFSLCLLYVITDFVSTRNYSSNNGDNYIYQFLLLPKCEKKAEATNSSCYEDKSNLTMKVLIGEESSAKLMNHNASRKSTNGTVFVEIKDINKSTENIFFIESKCATEKIGSHLKNNKGLVLNARQCCAIESTARMNLDHNVYLFHSCSLEDDFFQYSPKFVEELFNYPNIFVVRLNTTEVFLNSPLEELDKRKLLESSSYPIEHASDLIRLTLLWKFGGTYSDLDVVTIRSLNNLKTNWAGMESNDTIANGVLNFEPEGVGHNMLQKALEYANTHYKPSEWSSNGPMLITSIILQECRVRTVLEAQKRCSGNFTVLNKTVLYPIYYPDAKHFFSNSLGEKVVSLVTGNATYSVHLWNKISHDFVVTVGSTQAYALLANEYCPRVYQNCGPDF